MSIFTLGSFVVAADGALGPPPGGPAAIRFAWRGRPCRAVVAAGGLLSFDALAGRVPSTAEPGADRARAFAALRALARGLPPRWRVSLGADHSIRITAATTLPPTPAAVPLIAEMVRFALALDPYLDALEAGGSGSAKTWPG